MGFVENAKELVGLVQKLDNIDLIQKILQLQTDGLELVAQKDEAERRIRSLQDELEALNKQRVTEAELQFERDCYWRTKDGEFTVPYCSRCWDAEKSLIRMHQRDNGMAYCPACKTFARAWPEKVKPRPRRVAPDPWLQR